MDRTRREGRKLVAAQPSGESYSDTGETHSQASAASNIGSPPICKYEREAIGNLVTCSHVG